MSKNASIEIISKVEAHPNADKLDIVSVLGFQCVTQKGLYSEGDEIIYIRPDTILPNEDWSEEYRKYSPNRVKAVKLRGVYSEGIIVPFKVLPKHIVENVSKMELGDEISEMIGVAHYEPPQPQDLSAKGPLPYGIGATDEERWENIVDDLPYGEEVDITLKVDGQSCSFYYNIETDTFGVLGRKLELKPELSNNYTNHIKTYDIEQKLKKFCIENNTSLCIRGESYGNGIQNNNINPHSKIQKGWRMFSVYLMRERRYANKGDEFYFKNVAEILDLPYVDIIENTILSDDVIKKYSLDLTTINGNTFEGVVVKHKNGSFKIINKYYDSKK